MLLKLILLLLFLFPGLPVFADEFSGRVIGVSDGDTLTVLRDRSPVRIRLNGIDCPEKRQKFGQEAKHYTSSRCFGQTVTVLTRGQDRYGRTIGVVILSSGDELNRELLREGLAWWYRKFAPQDLQLQQLEAEARFAGRGLWIDPQSQPPWKFRHGQ